MKNDDVELIVKYILVSRELDKYAVISFRLALVQSVHLCHRLDVRSEMSDVRSQKWKAIYVCSDIVHFKEVGNSPVAACQENREDKAEAAKFIKFKFSASTPSSGNTEREEARA